MIRKTRSNISQNEQLLFEMSSPGKLGYQLPELDVPAVDAVELYVLGRDDFRTAIERSVSFRDQLLRTYAGRS